jgi:hypothetical protein
VADFFTIAWVATIFARHVVVANVEVLEDALRLRAQLVGRKLDCGKAVGFDAQTGHCDCSQSPDNRVFLGLPYVY